ncbi:MAG: hypothetical protein ACOVSW_25150 [Candidatus Kapaibacteriota bacterium]
MENEFLPINKLEGKWYILLTNFPMWLKGDKTSPTFNYTVETQNGITGLRDEVQSWKNGKKQQILGFDTPLDETNHRFQWRGKGLLSLLSSRWEIIYLDVTKEWAIIHFEKTLFTPEGYDVIARSQRISPETLASIQSILLELSINASLQPIVQK